MFICQDFHAQLSAVFPQNGQNKESIQVNGNSVGKNPLLMKEENGGK